MAKHSANFNWKTFGRHLRDMREDSDLGLRETARDANIHHATWCRAEQGKPLTVPIFLRLCARLVGAPTKHPAKFFDNSLMWVIGSGNRRRRAWWSESAYDRVIRAIEGTNG